MNKYKKIILGILIGTVLLCAGWYSYVFTARDVVQPKVEPKKIVVALPSAQPSKTGVTTLTGEAKTHFDLYSSTPYDMPLYSIMQISQIPPKAKESVDKFFEDAQGFYFLKYDKSKNKTFIILPNSVSQSNTYSRHDIEIAEVADDGTSIIHKVGYSGQNGETASQADEWIFDEASKPLKHIAHDENGDIKFTEIWNYSSSNPVKYEMKDSDGKLISIIKETSVNESNYRREHVFYDNDGNTKTSVSINYEGANISRFTYYNSADDIDSVTIISEYDTNGEKIGEKVYNENYELTNSLQADYENGNRKDIRLYDENGKILNEISS